MSRTSGRASVEEFLVKTCRMQGEEGLNTLRDRARRLREDLDATEEFSILEGMIGAILRSQDANVLVSRQARAMSRAEPIDPTCTGTLDNLFSHLASTPMPDRHDAGCGKPAATNTAFLEAYFSNYIEGTTFLIDEARAIAFEGRIPANRPKDGRDVLSTFRQLADHERMRSMPTQFEAFLEQIRTRHADLMGARPEVGPGIFKTVPNRAGNTVFVSPELVVGTLRHGHELLGSLRHPFARASFVHFLVSAVHPFADGNGKLARILMACELSAGRQTRVVIPTVYRDDYLGGQRALSRHGNVTANTRALLRCQHVTSRIVEDDLQACIERWASTHAFLEPGVDATLTDPSDIPLEERDGVLAPVEYWMAQDRPSGAFGM